MFFSQQKGKENKNMSRNSGPITKQQKLLAGCKKRPNLTLVVAIVSFKQHRHHDIGYA